MTSSPASVDPLPPGIRFGIVRGISFGMFGEPEVFMPQLRALGAQTVRVFLFWSQIEPEPGRFIWDTVDAFLGQLEEGDEAWITVCSSSPWATVRKTSFLPPSPAIDIEHYRRFVNELVRHCEGRIHFWQCDNEPCIPLLWAGTASEYLTHLDAFYHAVKAADPNALVVLGGAPPNAVGDAGSDQDRKAAAYFEQILREGGKYFDVFDVHLYGDPYVIPAVIETWHKRMAAFGYRKRVVAGEYNGPLLAQFPIVWPHLMEVMRAMGELVSSQTIEREETMQKDEPAMVALYERMTTLPPELQMFMAGCPAELEAKRHRWNCRDLVMRNLLALSADVRRTLCWNLAPEAPGNASPYHVMHLLFDKFKLMDYDGDLIDHRYPAAETLALLTRQLDGVEEVHRIEVLDRPSLYLFEVRRANRGPLLVVWERHDGFDAEDEPPVPFTWDWPSPKPHAIDAFGTEIPTEVRDGQLQLAISLTPVFIDGFATDDQDHPIPAC